MPSKKRVMTACIRKSHTSLISRQDQQQKKLGVIFHSLGAPKNFSETPAFTAGHSTWCSSHFRRQMPWRTRQPPGRQRRLRLRSKVRVKGEQGQNRLTSRTWQRYRYHPTIHQTWRIWQCPYWWDPTIPSTVQT